LQGHTAGVLLLITSGTLYGLYTVGIAKATKYLDPLAATFAIVASSTVIFGVAAAIYGEPGQIFQVDWKINLFLLISGLIGIAAGHTLFFINVKKVGNVLTNTFLLLTPLIGVTLASLFLGERLTWIQIFSGAVLIGGSYLLVTRGQARTFNENH
ncbi:DMT family transporter, partial [Candidatus Hakubella thermalkaliphila]